VADSSPDRANDDKLSDDKGQLSPFSLTEFFTHYLKVQSSSKGQQSPLNAAEIMEHAAPSMVRFDTYLLGIIPYTSGSGFFVASDTDHLHSCEIATASHVNDSAKSAWVTTHDGTVHQAILEKSDKAHGLDIYQLQGVEHPDKDCNALTLASSEPRVAEPVIAIGAAGEKNIFGFGGATAKEPKFHVGNAVGMLKRDAIEITFEEGEDMARPIVMTIPDIAANGYSGGPLLDNGGKVKGVTTAGNGKLSYQESLEFLRSDLNSIHNDK